MEMLEAKTSVAEMPKAGEGPSMDSRHIRKDSVNLKTGQ